MKASAAKLQAPTIDLMQIHNLVDWRTHLRPCAPGRSKRDSAISASPTTRSALDELAAVIRAEPIDFVQLAYSIDVRAAETRLLPLPAERGVAVLVNRPFSTGGLFGQVRGKPLPAWAPSSTAPAGANLPQVHSRPPCRHVRDPRTAKPDHMRDNSPPGSAGCPTRPAPAHG